MTDTADALPAELRSFLLDIKPGYDDDPTRAVYNHVWLIGDASAIGGAVQAEVDELAELARDRPGAAGPASRPAASPQPRAERRERAAADAEEGQRNERGRATRPADAAPVTVEDIRALAGPVHPALRAPGPQPDQSG